MKLFWMDRLLVLMLCFLSSIHINYEETVLCDPDSPISQCRRCLSAERTLKYNIRCFCLDSHDLSDTSTESLENFHRKQFYYWSNSYLYNVW